MNESSVVTRHHLPWAPASHSANPGRLLPLLGPVSVGCVHFHMSLETDHKNTYKLRSVQKDKKGFHIPVYEGKHNFVLIWSLTLRIGVLGAQNGNFGLMMSQGSRHK